MGERTHRHLQAEGPHHGHNLAEFFGETGRPHRISVENAVRVIEQDQADLLQQPMAGCPYQVLDQGECIGYIKAG
jgi:hypothetical protein